MRQWKSTLERNNSKRQTEFFELEYSEHPLISNCGLRTSWQKFWCLIPNYKKFCLAKQDQAGCYMWVAVKF